MPRFFLEVAYKGRNYAGFQVQENANTIQAETEKAMAIFFRQAVRLTGSSRTDSGVHARQNFFHFDFDSEINEAVAYNLNALLPSDIVIRRIIPMAADAHARFHAESREYSYSIYQFKNPFIEDMAFYFPYKLDFEALQTAANIIAEYNDFTSFSKRNTQAKTFSCSIKRSEWERNGICWVYHVTANRFLRGMVKGLVGTMLQVGLGKMTIAGFREVIQNRDNTAADFSVPGHGLVLEAVKYPEGYFDGRGNS